jgi:phosphatidylserine decarboxylase
MSEETGTVSLHSTLLGVFRHEDVNFLLTNRIPRLALTRFMGWFSKVEIPLVRVVSIFLWRSFCDVDLTDSADRDFRSLHAAFIRHLRPGARKVDADSAVLASPCDAIVGAHGRIESGKAWQIKGFEYEIEELLADCADAEEFRDGWYVTLRLTAGMYHRFHAPHDLKVEQVRYISGDTWNVNPIALRRIERLFCKNERAPVKVRIKAGDPIMLVPVAAVLVASIRMPFIDPDCGIRTGGERVIASDAVFRKGEEMGWFEHGSTIVVLTPKRWRPSEALIDGVPIQMGQALLRLDDCVEP